VSGKLSGQTEVERVFGSTERMLDVIADKVQVKATAYAWVQSIQGDASGVYVVLEFESGETVRLKSDQIEALQ
jgi:hypothetical protein